MRLLGVATFILVQVSFACRAIPDDVNANLLQEIQQKAVPEWDEFSSSLPSVTYTGSVTGKYHYLDKEKKPQIFHREYEFRVSRILDRRCKLIEQDASSGSHRITAVNPEYRFDVQPGTGSGEWILSKAGTAPETPVIPNNEEWWEKFSWKIGGEASLLDIFQRADVFRIDRLEPVLDDDKSSGKIRVTASHIGATGSKFGPSGASYTAILDPSLRYAITSFTVTLPRNTHGDVWSRTGTVTYHNNDSVIFPKRVEEMRTKQGTSFEPDESTVVEYAAPDAVAKLSEFYLPHYGIEDSAIRGDSRGRLWRFGYFLAGIALLLAAWQVLKRRSPSSGSALGS